jgi:mannose-1-phosphate guanylyltransferase/mannose-1-phosphate guanylyltransferase/phosphomannomutase
MLAVILAGDPGADLAPLTTEMPAAMVPLLDRPVMAHTVDLLRRLGVEEIVAVLHHHPDSVRRWFGDALAYRVEYRPLGTAGAVRTCRDLIGDEPFLVVSGSEVTDLDVGRLLDAHRAGGGVLTTCVKDGERTAIHVAQPEVFDYFPGGERVDWLPDVLGALRERGAGVHEHALEEYWRPVRAPADLRRAAFDLLEGRVALPVEGERLAEGLILGEGTALDGIAMIEPPVWIGAGVQIGVNARLQGPLVIGDEATIGDGAQLRGSVILPGSSVPREAIVADGIVGLADAWP